MRGKRGGLIILLFLIVFIGLSVLAQSGELSFNLGQELVLTIFHAAELIFAIVALNYTITLSKTHSKIMSRSFFSPNFFYINLAFIFFFFDAAWYFFTFLNNTYGFTDITDISQHIVGRLFLIIMIILLVHGLHKVHKDFVVKT